MLGLKKWLWAAAVAAVAAAPAAAQQGQVTTGGGRTTSSYSGTGGTLGGGAGQLGGTGGTGGINSGTSGGTGGTGSAAGAGGTELSATPLMTMTRPPQLTAPAGNARSSLQASNFLAGYYGNPYFQGQITAQTNAAPGGFGMPLYGTTGGAQGGRTGSTVTGGGGLAGRNTGGLGRNGTQQSGIVVPLPVQIAYAAELRFNAPPVAPTAIQADLRGVIDRSTMISNPQNVQIIVGEGNNVTLRGTVRDDEEARLVEGMVRLTPGVREIKNELTFPVARK